MIQQYAEDLTVESEEVKENWLMTRILGMLPSKHHHYFRTAWDNISGVDKIQIHCLNVYDWKKIG